MNLKRLKNYLVITLLALVGISASAQTSASAIEGKKQTLFSSANHASTPYRIPAIAMMKNGEILAISDYRPDGKDVGGGDVEIYAKYGTINSDGTYSWTPSSNDPVKAGEPPIITDGKDDDYGYGDAAVAVDPNTGHILVLSVGGNATFGQTKASGDYRTMRHISTDNGRNWTTSNITTIFKGTNSLLKDKDVCAMFFASGRLLVSSYKAPNAKYNRIYGALLTSENAKSTNYIVTTTWSDDNYNYVFYTDDLGETWSMLGTDYCISGADEAKLAELPNGDIMISSRATGGRIFNVYDVSAGKWGTQQSYTFASDCKATNGELLLYPGVTNATTGEKATILLQSLPTAENRSNVSVFYTTVDENSNLSTISKSNSWTKGIEVYDAESAYSAMVILPNNQIGFLYEEDYFSSNSNDNKKSGMAAGGTANIVYVPLTVEEITGGAYSYVEETTVEETVATPTFTPNGGELKYGNNTVTITCETADATIYYTTDGTTPTASSTKYTGAFTLTSNATVKAIAVKDGWTDSEVASVSFTYTVETAATPTFTPNGGEIEAGTMIAISCATECATIYYSIDGGEPTTVYSAPFALNNAATVKAVAKKEGWNNSATAQASFTIKQEVVVEIVATPVIAPNGGEIEAGTTISISCATEGATIYYSIDGTEPTEEYSAPFALTEATTVKAIAVKDGWNDSEIATALFTIKVEEPEEVNSWTVTPQVGVSGVLRRYYAMFSADKPFELPNGVTAYYVVKANSIYVTIMKVPAFKTIPANQGVILRSMIKSKYNPYTITATDDTSNLADLSDNLLSHTANGEKTIAESESIYCLGYQDGTKLWKFNKAEAGTIIPQNSAYIDLSAVSLNVLSIDIADDSEVSGIEDVNAEDAEVEYYNLQGVKVGNPEKGIYIMKQGVKTSKVVL